MVKSRAESVDVVSSEKKERQKLKILHGRGDSSMATPNMHCHLVGTELIIIAYGVENSVLPDTIARSRPAAPYKSVTHNFRNDLVADGCDAQSRTAQKGWQCNRRQADSRGKFSHGTVCELACPANTVASDKVSICLYGKWIGGNAAACTPNPSMVSYIPN